ncbi:MAG: single-stranded-DNA-specific exonuclease RecJ [Candidatus Adlerbacteria bacterium]|nr:single-stranded-DNA-specific exonuclease RecJ [Candidatus Adlerbacteria bacterium]
MKSYRVRERAHEDFTTDLLHARGVLEPEAQQLFLKPDFARDSHDPFLLPDMDKAVERILAAVRLGEKVCVWSDYDCDGIPGGVLLTEFLRSIGLTVRHYIPHRHKEGYGLNNTGLEDVAAGGVKLVITVDLGITDVDAVAFANEKGMDVIITDHHIVPEAMPPALAVVNPKRKDSAYPFDGLCGAGVAWKLVQAILQKNRFGIAEGQEKWLLDLVGVATLSDMVPLLGENRMLARYGLTVLRRNRRPGFAALLSMLKIKANTLTEDDVGFMVSPRINAASRMDSPELAARLLAATDPIEAKSLAGQLDGINAERKTLVATTVKEVNKRMLESDMQTSPIIVMGNPTWRPGILGLVANSLAEAHNKVVFLWGREGGEMLRGSVRSDGNVNIVDLMRLAHRATAEGGASGLFDDFGGHFAAGGFSVPPERVHELLPRLVESYTALRATAGTAKEVVVDRQLDLAEVGHAQRALTHLAPFGMDNAKPLFLVPNVSVASVRTFGKKMDHLELALVNENSRVSGIAFFSTPDSFQKPIISGMRADIVGHVELDWRGQPRLRIVDIL